MEVMHEDNGKKGLFYIESAGLRLAEMTYVWAGDNQIIIDHTEVSPSLKGQGAGKKMLEQAIAIARNRAIKILPLCPFAKGMFDKTPAYRDVL
jgi:uncharacterized protein